MTSWSERLKSLGYTWKSSQAPADHEDIKRLEQFGGRRLPEDYASFLAEINGCELSLRDNLYIRLWPVQQIIEWSTGYDVIKDMMPGALLIGDDFGSEGLIYDMRPIYAEENYPLAFVSYIGGSWHELWPAPLDFTNLLLQPESNRLLGDL